MSYIGGALYASTFSLREYSERVAAGRFGIDRHQALTPRDQLRYYLLMKLFGLRLDKAAAEARFPGILRKLAPEIAGLRLMGAVRDEGPQLVLTRYGCGCGPHNARSTCRFDFRDLMRTTSLEALPKRRRRADDRPQPLGGADRAQVRRSPGLGSESEAAPDQFAPLGWTFRRQPGLGRNSEGRLEQFAPALAVRRSRGIGRNPKAVPTIRSPWGDGPAQPGPWGPSIPAVLRDAYSSALACTDSRVWMRCTVRTIAHITRYRIHGSRSISRSSDSRSSTSTRDGHSATSERNARRRQESQFVGEIAAFSATINASSGVPNCLTTASLPSTTTPVGCRSGLRGATTCRRSSAPAHHRGRTAFAPA